MRWREKEVDGGTDKDGREGNKDGDKGTCERGNRKEVDGGTDKDRKERKEEGGGKKIKKMKGEEYRKWRERKWIERLIKIGERKKREEERK